MYKIRDYLPVFLAVILYLLVFWVRSIQGGWDIKINTLALQRQSLDQKISQYLPSPQAELLSGILLGQSKDLPPGFKLALRDTSTLHIVVASGQNLSMVGGLFLAMAGLIKRRIAITLSLLAVCFYTVLVGFQIPVLRAAIMFSLASIAQFYGREKDGLRVLSLTAALMLLINPGWVKEISFQLSILATFGVIVLAPILLKWFRLPLIGQDLAVTLGAQAMVTPIIAQNFHQFSMVGLITNIFILWTIPFIMVGGVVMLLAGTVFSFLGTLTAILVNALLTYFIYIVHFFASLPFAWQYVREVSWVVWLGYYFVLAGAVFMLSLIYDKKSVRG